MILLLSTCTRQTSIYFILLVNDKAGFRVMDKNDIIDRIGYFRSKAKLSQKALSIDIDMNIGYINRMESRRDFLPSLEVLLKIIQACGITEEEFFYGDLEHYRSDKQLLEKLKDLSNEKREALLKLL